MSDTPPRARLSAPPGFSAEVPAAAAPAGGPSLVYVGIAIVAVLYVARDLLIPLVLSILLAFVLAPVARALRKAGAPRVASVLVAVLLAVGMISAFAVLMGRQLADLANELPVYQATVSRKLDSLFGGGGGLLGRASDLLRDLGERLGPRAEVPAGPGTGAAAPPLPVEIREPAPGVLTLMQRVIGPLLGPVATTGIVVVLVIFLLLYREDLRDRLIKLIGSRDLQRTTAALNEAAARLSRFFLAQVALNAGFGVFISIGLWAIGIPNPLLWGMVAGLMRFVPFIGGVIAAAFPLLLAVAVDPGWTMLIWVVALFAVSEPIMGQVFEPLIYGHSTGLSPVAVLLATAFWAWLWGPVGLLVATPLTVGLVVLGRHVDRLEFLDVLLGDRAALEPAEAFYQRALAGDGDGLAEQADLHLRTHRVATYYDEVALRGLALAQEDASRGVLDRGRLDALRARVDDLLDDLAEHEDDVVEGPVTEGPVAPDDPPAPPEADTEAVPPGWATPGAVLLVAGRGRLDAQATAMLGQVLARRGFGVAALPNDALRDPDLATRHPSVRAVVFSALEGGSGAASARYALRRLRRRFPAALTVVGLWGATRDSPTYQALKAEAETIPEAHTLRDAAALLLRQARVQEPLEAEAA
ncbi:AI-2E family transporter [Roseomonas sp. CCTCC AB2023176]|uniref:AI-2E family transporter n=1 Tax=Roseomonas sp. CCTCC AB2023176 TaxID=3342640 RepID=UPI0035E06098